MRPTFDGPDWDKGAIADLGGRGVHSWHATPRSNRDIPGASVTELETVIRSRGGSGREIPAPVHEPSNWSSANRPGDRRGGSAYRIHSRLGRLPVSGGDLAFRGSDQAVRIVAFRSAGACDRRRIPRRSRSAWTTRAALDQVRIVVDGAGHPVDVRRLERRDLAERVVVELAERASPSPGPPPATAPVSGGSCAPGRGRAARSASRRAAARGRRHRWPWAAGRTAGSDRRCCRPPGCAAGRRRSCRPDR